MEWIANVEIEELKVPFTHDMFKPKYPHSVPEPFRDEPQWAWKCPICGKIPFSETLVLDCGKVEVSSLPGRFTQEFVSAIQEAIQGEPEEPVAMIDLEVEPDPLFVCERCGRAFQSRRGLQGHMNLTHSKEGKVNTEAEK
jgi:hypothetical protein